MPFSKAYLEFRKLGPFPGQIDPWAEIGRYFHQVHSEMIGQLIRQIQNPLEDMGYLAGRETSLTIAANREPDIYIERQESAPVVLQPAWAYSEAAAEILAEPGIAIDWQVFDQHAIFIRFGTELVTVVELISPSNKMSPGEIQQYQTRREALLRDGINIVEIDLTRSYTRLLQTAVVETSPYHALIYMPGETPRFINMGYGQPLKRIALPLRQAVIGVELQEAYEYGYQEMRIAAHILEEGRYTDDDLPFPTTLTKAQRQAALDKVAAWRAELERLKSEAI